MFGQDENNIWLEYPSTGFEDIENARKVANSLDSLAFKVRSAPVASLEAFCIAFNAIVGEDFKPSRTVSLEGFSGAPSPMHHLATRITQHSNNMHGAINLALEDFNKDALAKFKEIVDGYRKARAQLDHVKTDLEPTDSVVKINHERVWKLFNKNNKFVKPESIKEDVMDVGKIVGTIKDAAVTLSSGRPVQLDPAKYELMMNTFVVIKDNSITFESPEPPKPKDEYSAGDIAWIVGWSVMFNVVGLIGSLIFKKKTASEADRKRGVNEMLAFINTIKGFDRSITEIESAIKALQQTEENKEMSAMLINSAIKLTKHITDVTYGAAVLFTKISKS